MAIKHSIRKLLDKFGWYPPAEASISLSALASSLFSRKVDLKKELCRQLDVTDCVLASDARTLLYQLLQSLHKHDTKKRNEVLIPGYTCYSVAAAIAKAGLKIKVYDIETSNFQVNIPSLKNAITDNTLAIVSQHLFGIPIPLHEVASIAKNAGIYHIEDAAQAFGGSLDEELSGTIGDFGLFSFGRGKALPIGSGGALVSKHHTMPMDITLKQEKTGVKKFITAIITQISIKPWLYWIPEKLPLGLGETCFDTDFQTSAMPSLSQKLALTLMLKHSNKHRQEIAGIYQAILHDNKESHSRKGQAIYTRYPLLATVNYIPSEFKRLGVRRMYPEAILDVDSIKPFLADSQVSTEQARYIAKNLITLPTHKSIHHELADDIARRIKRLLADNENSKLNT